MLVTHATLIIITHTNQVQTRNLILYSASGLMRTEYLKLIMLIIDNDKHFDIFDSINNGTYDAQSSIKTVGCP